jgi:two-component system CheB/CheR fusion protein
MILINRSIYIHKIPFSTHVSFSNSNNNNNSHLSIPRKILIVDDDPDITSAFNMILEMNGFEVDAYTDPLLALSNFKPNSYGLALLDIRMPKMNGFELYKKIKKH